MNKFLGGLISLIPGTTFLGVFLMRSAMTPEGRLNFTLFDDAMISMTYARTLAETGEWVWYPGADRVQGFTNPLWTLYMALLHALGLEGSSAAFAVSLTGIGLILMSSVCVMVLVRQALGSGRHSIAFALLAGGSIPFLYPLTFWTLRGMEVGLLALLLLFAILCAMSIISRTRAGQKITANLSVAISLTVIGIATRMDFAVPAIALAAMTCLLVTRASRFRVALLLSGAVLATTVFVLVIQQVYWGSFLPNTYQLKVNGYPLYDRILRGLFVNAKLLPFITVSMLGFLVMVRAQRKPIRDLGLILMAPIVLVFAYSIWVGGDAWEYGGLINRYMAVVLPPGVAIGLIGAGVLAHSRDLFSRRALFIGAMIIPISGLGYGVVSNPMGYNLLLGFTAFAVLLLISGLGVVALLWVGNQPNIGVRHWPVAALAALLYVATTSAPSYWLWIQDGGLFVEIDQQLVQSSTLLKQLTEPTAVIATAWAGAPAYYTNRPSIDLLGKSDAHVASVSPRGLFHPGHNKWDYEYSILQMKPDVVRELFLPSPDEVKTLESWGYREGCYGDFRAHFLMSSDRIAWNALKACPAS